MEIAEGNQRRRMAWLTEAGADAGLAPGALLSSELAQQLAAASEAPETLPGRRTEREAGDLRAELDVFAFAQYQAPPVIGPADGLPKRH